MILGPLILGCVAGMLFGGRLGNWSEIRMRWTWVVLLALVIRIVVANTSWGFIDWLRYVYVASLVALIAWTLWNVDRLFGIWLVSIGSTMNLVVIVANDFRMPIVPEAASKFVELGHLGQYVILNASTRLPWLGDTLVVPSFLGGVFSPGDVVIGIGLGIVAFAGTRFPASPSKLDQISSTSRR